mgnify:CR=1 FL=1
MMTVYKAVMKQTPVKTLQRKTKMQQEQHKTKKNEIVMNE